MTLTKMQFCPKNVGKTRVFILEQMPQSTFQAVFFFAYSSRNKAFSQLKVLISA